MSTKLERINQWMLLATNMGIIAGFVLIALQLQQNTKALELQARAIADNSSLSAESAFMGETLAEAYLTAQLNPAELTDAQLGQVSGYLTTKLISVHQTYLDYINGIVPEEIWVDAKQRHVKEFNFPVARAYWTSVAPIRGNEGFTSEMDNAYRAAQGKHYYMAFPAFKKEIEKELKTVR